MLTIFAVPKAFRGKFKAIQENAIKSWINLGPDIEVILFGDETGVKEISRKYKLRHFQDLKTNEYGTPLVSYLFQKAQEKGNGDFLLYINSDIILPADFLEAIKIVKAKFKNFLAIGERIDAEVESLINFNKKRSLIALYRRVNLTGKRHGPTGIDYFLFSKYLWHKIPDFAVGRFYWDNWLVYEGLKRSKNLIDLTPAVKVIHQNHPTYTILSKLKRSEFEEEKRKNGKLAGRNLYNRFNANYYVIGLSKSRLILPSLGIERVIFNLKKNLDHFFTVRLKNYFPFPV